MSGDLAAMELARGEKVQAGLAGELIKVRAMYDSPTAVPAKGIGEGIL
jgi:hypothetical protein